MLSKLTEIRTPIAAVLLIKRSNTFIQKRAEVSGSWESELSGRGQNIGSWELWDSVARHVHWNISASVTHPWLSQRFTGVR